MSLVFQVQHVLVYTILVTDFVVAHGCFYLVNYLIIRNHLNHFPSSLRNIIDHASKHVFSYS